MFVLLIVSLLACKKEIPPELQAQAEEHSPYATVDAQKTFYLSVGISSPGIVYMDDIYICSSDITLQSIKLPTHVNDTVEKKRVSLCSDPMCSHQDLNCPAMMRHPEAEFLIDMTESNGELPVIYYFRCMAGQDDLEFGQSEVIRYDVATNQAVQVAVSHGPIRQMMTYKDSIYYTVQNAKDQYELNRVNKTGGSVQTISAGECYIELLGANDQGVYCNDEKGNVYLAELNLSNVKKIYAVKEVYHSINQSSPANIDMFVDGDYLYFFADFEPEYFPWYNSAEYGDKILFLNHSIRRVPLNAPKGDGEVVAEDVFEYAVYGVYNGVLYYGPFDVKTMIHGNLNQHGANLYHSKGTIRGVRLDTLETFDVVTDCGLNFEAGPFYVNDRCLIAVQFPYRDGMVSSSGSLVLYDFQTGAIYSVRQGMRLLKEGTIAE